MIQSTLEITFVLLVLLGCSSASPNEPVIATVKAYKTKDYEVVVPKKVDENDVVISHNIPHFFEKIKSGGESKKTKNLVHKLHYVVPIEGEPKHLELSPNREIVRAEAVVESHGSGKLRKRRNLADKNFCYYTGKIRNEIDSKVAVSTCDGLAGYIRTKRGYYLIEPVKGEKNSAHKLYPPVTRGTPNQRLQVSRSTQRPQALHSIQKPQSVQHRQALQSSTKSQQRIKPGRLETRFGNHLLSDSQLNSHRDSHQRHESRQDVHHPDPFETLKEIEESRIAKFAHIRPYAQNINFDIFDSKRDANGTESPTSTGVSESTTGASSDTSPNSSSSSSPGSETSSSSIASSSSETSSSSTASSSASSGASSPNSETSSSSSGSAETGTTPIGASTTGENSSVSGNGTETSTVSSPAGGSSGTTVSPPPGGTTSTPRLGSTSTRAPLNNSDIPPDSNGTIPAELHIETLVVLDHAILNYHKEVDIEHFVMTVFNMAHDLFHDSTLGTNINLAIVRLIRLESEDHEMNIASNKNPTKVLDYFRKWQNKVNPKEDTHPNHHDVALLLTRVDVCADDKTCGFLGAARLQGICDPDNQAGICQDNGLRLGFTIAHEIGHTLGMLHDQPLITEDDKVIETVMTPHIPPRMMRWSDCSRATLKKFLDSGFGACLYDAPTEHSFLTIDAMPGIMYDADFQCKEIFGPNAALCMTGLECHNLICYIEDKGCVESNMQPAEGTMCGENKWCFQGECVEIGERPAAVHGEWGGWSEWSECTRTCGSGVASQERHCNNPPPAHGGKYCEGEHRRYRICSTEPCELGEPSFRDVQCSEFNSWLYPEDGKIHQWKSYPIHDENPCALYCVNELGAVASLLPRVIDGTTCYRGIRDICIEGLCKEIPCDLDLQSNAVEDRCGVCKGDGTSCNMIRGEQSFHCNDGREVEKKFLEIPAGAVNVKLEELIPSESRIEVRDKNDQNIYITGDTFGMFNVHGSKAWVGMIRTKQEAISIQGPLREAVSVWVGVKQNSTIKYSYGILAKTKRKPEFSWDFLDWSRCSTECGMGTQEAIAKCVEKDAGLVDERYCRNVTKTKGEIRPCEMAPCTPRWFVGDWGECTKCPFGTKSRIVKCFKPLGVGEGELDFVMDGNCAGPKPRSFEMCTCRNFRSPGKKGSTPSSPNPALNLEKTKVRTIIDMDELSTIRLTVHTELEGNKYPAGLPHPKNSNESLFVLHDKAAMKFLHTMQQDFANNKSRI